DLAVAMTARHYRVLQRLIADLPAEAAPELRMLREFDPRVAGAAGDASRDGAAPAGVDDAPAPDVPDPWYGGLKDFEDTREPVEVPVPGTADPLHALAVKSQWYW